MSFKEADDARWNTHPLWWKVGVYTLTIVLLPMVFVLGLVYWTGRGIKELL